ncbi:hypothetical protein FF011L_25190 [Roseimaritima multifibrata]|uniref:Anaphase-promoting complex, cyclosome, subunit 3 n=1 Tax=Roseimaritima multifibrata TaxID=1930274 RepID=A0A517MFW3_9BACT|nr:hypothetical protein [Roseimaritima multifibrata]QDS93746.1 hypothetical protein FF011L_25190 [Roseimaritima multifibrata]
MLNSKNARNRFPLSGLLVLAFVVTAGCEPVPAPVSELPAVPAGIEMVDMDSGRFDWNTGVGGLIVNKPAPFTFLRSKDEPLVSAEFLAARPKPAPFDAETERKLANLMGSRAEPFFSQRPFFSAQGEIDLGTDAGAVSSFALSADGKYLLVVAKEVVVYEVESRQLKFRLGGVEGSVSHCLWPAGDTFYVADEKAIHRATVGTSESLQQVKTLSQPLATWQHAAKAPVIFGCYQDGKVFRLDTKENRFVDLKVTVGGKLKVLAVQPNGDGILCTADNGVTTFRFDNERLVNRQLTALNRDNQVVSLACWTSTSRLWSDGDNIYSLPSENAEESAKQPERSPRLLWKPLALIGKYDKEDNQNQITAVVRRKDIEGNLHLSVADVYHEDLTHSIPFDLQVENLKDVALDGRGLMVAQHLGNAIQIHRRGVWEFPNLARTRYIVATAFRTQNFDRIDQLAKFALAGEGYRWGLDAQEMFGIVQDTCAEVWLQVRQRWGETEDEAEKQKYAEFLSKAEKWAETSVVGMSSQLDMKIQFGWKARGDGLGYTVSQQGWKVLERELAEAAEMLDDWLKEDPYAPAIMYAHRMTIAMGRGESHSSVEEHLRVATALYPTHVSLHSAVAEWLAPKWSGSEGDSAGYLAAVMKHGDPEVAARQYARIVCNKLGHYTEPVGLVLHGHYDVRSAVLAAESMVSLEPAYDWHLVRLLALANSFEMRTQELILAKYMQAHFLYDPSRYGERYQQFMPALYENLPE